MTDPNNLRCAAIVLSAGRGSRMESSVPKQYMELCGRPMITYALEAFQKHERIDRIVMVVSPGDEDYCREEIVGRYGFCKVKDIVPGGAERSDSVYRGLLALKECDIVLIHDGARPLVDRDTISRCIEDAVLYQACVAAVPVKDTIKIENGRGEVESTPDRSLLWSVQTPQAFRYDLIAEAYRRSRSVEGITFTDDAMTVERMMNVKVRLTMGNYRNIKVTTPEDMVTAGAFLRDRES